MKKPDLERQNTEAQYFIAIDELFGTAKLCELTEKIRALELKYGKDAVFKPDWDYDGLRGLNIIETRPETDEEYKRRVEFETYHYNQNIRRERQAAEKQVKKIRERIAMIEDGIPSLEGLKEMVEALQNKIENLKEIE